MSESVDPALVAALAALTPEQRDVVGLRIVADLPVKDVARILRKRPDAVKSLHHRALTALADRLG
jgi:DNA-directed RNA polymerase specialized sigma24 family protein